MTILVTRPSPSGAHLVGRLRTLGRSVYYAPLINFTPGCDLSKLPGMLRELSSGDLVFISSQHSVQYVDAVISRNGMTWPDHLVYHAIGKASGLSLHRISNLPVIYPKKNEISEALLMLPTLQRLKGKRAVILRGNGGRTLLGDTLQERGANVRYYECYQRNAIYYDGNLQAAAWRGAGVNTLVVTSGEMLQQLYALVPKHHQSPWLLRCCVIVVSQRTANLARNLGWSNIQVADSANNDALMRVLIK